MITYKHLYPQVYDFSSLLRAWRKARRGKRYAPAAAESVRALVEEARQP